DYWLSHSSLGPLQRFMRAMREIVLGGVRRSGFGVRREESGVEPSQGVRHVEPDFGVEEVRTEHRTPNSEGRLVLFLDEIAVVRSLPFSTDESFTAIGHRDNRRTNN